jgi:hypothetical protein
MTQATQKGGKQPAKSKQPGQAVNIGLKIGQPGMAVVHQGVDANTFQQHTQAYPWIAQEAQALIDALVNAPVLYEFDSFADVFSWVKIRLVTRHLLVRITSDPDDATESETEWKRRYGLIEGVRTTFEQCGELSAPFTFLNVTYTLAKQEHHHYYVTNSNKTVVTYNGKLKAGDARSFIDKIDFGKNVGKSESGLCDEFVCAFFAEPTRWPEEHVFNLLACSETLPVPAQGLTGNMGSSVLLPMASGSTWEAGLRVLGTQAPMRTVRFAAGCGLTQIIDEVLLTGVASVDQFCTDVRIRLLP